MWYFGCPCNDLVKCKDITDVLLLYKVQFHCLPVSEACSCVIAVSQCTGVALHQDGAS